MAFDHFCTVIPHYQMEDGADVFICEEFISSYELVYNRLIIVLTVPHHRQAVKFIVNNHRFVQEKKQ